MWTPCNLHQCRFHRSCLSPGDLGRHFPFPLLFAFFQNYYNWLLYIAGLTDYAMQRTLRDTPPPGQLPVSPCGPSLPSFALPSTPPSRLSLAAAVPADALRGLLPPGVLLPRGSFCPSPRGSLPLLAVLPPHSCDFQYFVLAEAALLPLHSSIKAVSLAAAAAAAATKTCQSLRASKGAPSFSSSLCPFFS